MGSVAFAFEFLMRGSKRCLFFSGLAIALGVGMRDALLLFAAVLGALVFFATPQQRLRAGGIFGAGLAAGLLPLAVFQWLALVVGLPPDARIRAARAGEGNGPSVPAPHRPCFTTSCSLPPRASRSPRC